MELISDIHLEYDPTYRINRIGEILIIAGDLGKVTNKSYYTFLADVSDRYDHIILVAGNHEYYGTTIENGERLIREMMAKLPNVHYLQCGKVVINEIEFLGCTLWSEPTVDHWLTNDGSSIKDFSLKHYQDLHTQHRDWLTGQLNIPSTRKRIVVTHYLPSYRCIDPKYTDEDTNSFFASHLDDLVPKANLWLCGHTHSDNAIQINGTFVFINPKGYPGENDREYYPLEI